MYEHLNDPHYMRHSTHNVYSGVIVNTTNDNGMFANKQIISTKP